MSSMSTKVWGVQTGPRQDSAEGMYRFAIHSAKRASATAIVTRASVSTTGFLMANPLNQFKGNTRVQRSLEGWQVIENISEYMHAICRVVQLPPAPGGHREGVSERHRRTHVNGRHSKRSLAASNSSGGTPYGRAQERPWGEDAAPVGPGGESQAPRGVGTAILISLPGPTLFHGDAKDKTASSDPDESFDDGDSGSDNNEVRYHLRNSPEGSTDSLLSSQMSNLMPPTSRRGDMSLSAAVLSAGSSADAMPLPCKQLRHGSVSATESDEPESDSGSDDELRCSSDLQDPFASNSCTVKLDENSTGVLLTTSFVLPSRDACLTHRAVFLEQPVEGTAARWGGPVEPVSVRLRGDKTFFCSVGDRISTAQLYEDSAKGPLEMSSAVVAAASAPLDGKHWACNEAAFCEPEDDAGRPHMLGSGAFSPRAGESAWDLRSPFTPVTEHVTPVSESGGDYAQLGYTITLCNALEERRGGGRARRRPREAQQATIPRTPQRCDPSSSPKAAVRRRKSLARVKPLPLPLLLSRIPQVRVGDTHIMVTHVSGVTRHYIVLQVRAVFEDSCEYDFFDPYCDHSSGGAIFTQSGDFVGLQHQCGNAAYGLFISSIVRHLFQSTALGICRIPIGLGIPQGISHTLAHTDGTEHGSEDTSVLPALESSVEDDGACWARPCSPARATSGASPPSEAGRSCPQIATALAAHVGAKGDFVIDYEEFHRYRLRENITQKMVPPTLEVPHFMRVWDEWHSDLSSIVHILHAFSYHPGLMVVALRALSSRRGDDCALSAPDTQGPQGNTAFPEMLEALGTTLVDRPSRSPAHSGGWTQSVNYTELESVAHRMMAVTSLGGVSIILELIDAHHEHQELVEAALFILACVSITDTGREVLLTGHAVTAILDVMVEHSQSIRSQQWGCYALRNLTQARHATTVPANADVTPEVAEACESFLLFNGIPHVLRSIRIHMLQRHLVSWGASLLANVVLQESKFDSEALEAALEEGVLPIIVDALERYDRDILVLEGLASLIRALCCVGHFYEPKHHNSTAPEAQGKLRDALLIVDGEHHRVPPPATGESRDGAKTSGNVREKKPSRPAWSIGDEVMRPNYDSDALAFDDWISVVSASSTSCDHLESPLEQPGENSFMAESNPINPPRATATGNVMGYASPIADVSEPPRGSNPARIRPSFVVPQLSDFVFDSVAANPSDHSARARRDIAGPTASVASCNAPSSTSGAPETTLSGRNLSFHSLTCNNKSAPNTLPQFVSRTRLDLATGGGSAPVRSGHRESSADRAISGSGLLGAASPRSNHAQRNALSILCLAELSAQFDLLYWLFGTIYLTLKEQRSPLIAQYCLEVLSAMLVYQLTGGERENISVGDLRHLCGMTYRAYRTDEQCSKAALTVLSQLL